MSIWFVSDGFENHQAIPRLYTGEGGDTSPSLRWNAPPAGTRQLVLVVDDPDAPGDEPFVHWVLYNLGPEVRGLPKGIKPDEKLSMPKATQGRNSFNKIGYGGPMPPKGDPPHHYHFHLYAVKTAATLPPGLTKDALMLHIEGEVLDEGELIGTYQRS